MLEEGLDVIKRRRIRDELLISVYNYYSDNNGEPFLANFEKSEDKLALRYLENKGYVSTTTSLEATNIYLKVSGIDRAEQIIMEE